MERISNQDFLDSGLLWWVNMILHTFGYSIVFDTELDILYPAKVSYRGFNEETNDLGYSRMSKLLKESDNQHE